MPRAEETDPEGLDYGWVMQVTFVLTVVAGAPLVAVLSLARPLPTWEARVAFAVRVGAVVWILTALSVYAYARRRTGGAGSGGATQDGTTEKNGTTPEDVETDAEGLPEQGGTDGPADATGEDPAE